MSRVAAQDEAGTTFASYVSGDNVQVMFGAWKQPGHTRPFVRNCTRNVWPSKRLRRQQKAIKCLQNVGPWVYGHNVRGAIPVQVVLGSNRVDDGDDVAYDEGDGDITEKPSITYIIIIVIMVNARPTWSKIDTGIWMCENAGADTRTPRCSPFGLDSDGIIYASIRWRLTNTV